MTIRTILVPTDFSISAEKALKQAAEIAENFRARIVLVHIVSIPGGVTGKSNIDPGDHRCVTVEEYARETSFDALNRAAEVYKSHGLDVDMKVELGEIVPTILSVATREGADLIVLGTHGRTGLARMIFGSVASAVVARSMLPVMTVRDGIVGEHEGRTEAEDRIRDETEG